MQNSSLVFVCEGNSNLNTFIGPLTKPSADQFHGAKLLDECAKDTRRKQLGVAMVVLCFKVLDLQQLTLQKGDENLSLVVDDCRRPVMKAIKWATSQAM